MDPKDDEEVTTFKKTLAPFTRDSVSPPLLKVMTRLLKKKGRKLLEEAQKAKKVKANSRELP